MTIKATAITPSTTANTFQLGRLGSEVDLIDFSVLVLHVFMKNPLFRLG
jgi:hypothetical protein